MNDTSACRHCSLIKEKGEFLLYIAKLEKENKRLKKAVKVLKQTK